MEFGDKLQQLRKQKNMTQEELADALYISRAAVSKWESGRGYPNIESLKGISGFFAVSIDDLLSSQDLVSIAETEGREKVGSLCDLLFGILDCIMVIMLFLPIFGQPGEGRILFVSLLDLDSAPDYIRIIYFWNLCLTVAWGAAQLALQNCGHSFWGRIKWVVSLVLSICGTLFFIASRQPYAATFVFSILLIKGTLLIWQR